MQALAFDADGDLWGSVIPGVRVVGYQVADLETSGTPAPTWTLTGDGATLDSLAGPDGLAFDAEGYLWVGSTLGLQAFSPATRTGPAFEGVGPPADFHITTLCVGPGYYDGGRDPCSDDFMNLAFDAAGTLWVSTNFVSYEEGSPSAYHLVAYSRAQLQNAKNDDQPTPVRDLVFDLHNTPFADAFDADGNLWVGGISDWDAGEPNLLRLPAESLALDAGSNQTLAVPDISVAIPGYPSVSLAFSPIPPGLPLQP